jgi:hypothetical protein
MAVLPHCPPQVDEEASIRANTTVLLGNLADHLSGEAVCGGFGGVLRPGPAHPVADFMFLS